MIDNCKITLHRSIVAIALLLCCSSTVLSQELPPITNYSPIEYGGNNQNWMVSQDRDRIMYFANDYGLLEYNGQQWYSHTTHEESSMRAVHFHDGKLYTGSYMDFGYWIRDVNGGLTYNSLTAGKDIAFHEDEQFWNIVSHQSTVLFQSLKAIYSYNPTTNKITTVVEDSNLTRLFVVDNRVFYNSSSTGLYEIKNGSRIPVAGISQLEGNCIAMGIRGDVIEIITSTGKVMELSGERAVTKIENLTNLPTRVYSAIFLKNGGYAVGTVANGLFLLGPDGSQKYHFNQQRGLSNNTVLSIFEDVDKNLWIGLDNGVDYINLQSPYKIFKDRTGKLGTTYTALSLNGDLYLGTNQGVYYKSSKAKDFILIEGTKGQVWSLQEINGTIFCGHDRGTFVLEGNTAIKIAAVEGTWQFLQLEHLPDIIIQGNYDGLYVLKRKGKNWTLKNKINGFDYSAKDFTFFDDKIYVSHDYKGLFELEINQDLTSIDKSRLINSMEQSGKSDVIAVNNYLMYANGTGVYVKAKGDHSFKKNNSLSRFIEGEEFISGNMTQVDLNSFWLFTRNSIVEVMVEPLESKFETRAFDIPQSVRLDKAGNEFILELENQQYLFGTTQGYIVLEDQQLEEHSSQIYINTIKTEDQQGLVKIENLDGDIDLSYDTNSLKLFFHTTNYTNLSSIKFEYQLEPISMRWSSFENGALLLENLEPGTYTLRVRVNDYGDITTAGYLTKKIIINHPWYLSKWAWTIYMVLLLFILWIIHNFYDRYYSRIKEREIIRESMDSKLELLQNKNHITTLNNQKLNSEIDSRNRELAIATMAMIKKNEALNEIKEELSNIKQTQNVVAVKNLVEKNLKAQQDWQTFEQAFTMADKDYIKALKHKHPKLTSGDLRLCLYIRLNLSSKEIAPMFNISVRSVEVKRYRLRKKLDLNRKIDLYEYLITI